MLTGKRVDYMSEVVGAENRWDPFPQPGDPMVSIGTIPDKPPIWMIDDGRQTRPNFRAEYFISDLSIGLFMERQIDFYLDEEHPLVFARMYRNADDLSRAFGVGANDSLWTSFWSVRWVPSST